MTRVVLMVACVLILAAFGGALASGTPRKAGVETLSPSAMMKDTRALPVEAFDAV